MRKVGGAQTILFYPSEEVPARWVAHCLDWDIVGTGDSPGQAFAELVELLGMQIEVWDELGKEAVRPEPAPRAYWEALERAVDLPPIDFSELAERLLPGGGDVPEKCRGALLHDRKLLAVGG